MSYQVPVNQSRTSALAIVSLVGGIASWVPLPVIGAIVAVVCGHLARREIREAPQGSIQGAGMALAGLILGYAHLVLCVLFLTLFVAIRHMH